MMADKKKRSKRKKRLEQERQTEAIDNWDIVDISENRPRDYWAIREAREEYCKEYYGTENC
jgi:hypothetical protein